MLTFLPCTCCPGQNIYSVISGSHGSQPKPLTSSTSTRTTLDYIWSLGPSSANKKVSYVTSRWRGRIRLKSWGSISLTPYSCSWSNKMQHKDFVVGLSTESYCPWMTPVTWLNIITPPSSPNRLPCPGAANTFTQSSSPTRIKGYCFAWYGVDATLIYRYYFVETPAFHDIGGNSNLTHPNLALLSFMRATTGRNRRLVLGNVQHCRLAVATSP